jgi:hypothetical protein
MREHMNNISKSIVFSVLLMTLASCNNFTPKPTETPIPTATSLPTSTNSPEPTSTPTNTPTETPIPQPASLTGTIFLSNGNVKPLTSSVELRQKDSFILIGKGDTDSNGVYKIENIDPGSYALWVLITTKSETIPGCRDIAPPDSSWRIGIKFGEDKAITIENAYLSKALLLMANMPPSTDLKAQGYFAVLEGFELASGIENEMDVTLFCMQN